MIDDEIRENGTTYLLLRFHALTITLLIFFMCMIIAWEPRAISLKTPQTLILRFQLWCDAHLKSIDLCFLSASFQHQNGELSQEFEKMHESQVLSFNILVIFLHQTTKSLTSQPSQFYLYSQTKFVRESWSYYLLLTCKFWQVFQSSLSCTIYVLSVIWDFGC